MSALNETEVFLLAGVVGLALVLMSFDRPIRNAIRKLKRWFTRTRR